MESLTWWQAGSCFANPWKASLNIRLRQHENIIMIQSPEWYIYIYIYIRNYIVSIIDIDGFSFSILL